MMLVEDVYTYLRDLLRDNITDPIARGSHWIYPDYPREDAQMPRISLLHISTTRTEIGLGDEGSRLYARFEIGIWTNSRVTATIDSTKYKGSRLREYIGDRVLEAFINKRKYLFDTYGIMDAYLVSSAIFPYDPARDLYQKNYSIEIVWDVPKA